MTYIIPDTKTTWASQLAYTIAAQEKLRLDHNEHGTRFRNKEITQTEWDNYKKNCFQPLSLEIGKKQSDLRQHIPDDVIAQNPLSNIAEDGAITFPNGDSWESKMGSLVALLSQLDHDANRDQMSKIMNQTAFHNIPEDAINEVNLNIQTTQIINGSINYPNGQKVPVKLKVEETIHSSGRVDKIIHVPTLNTNSKHER